MRKYLYIYYSVYRTMAVSEPMVDGCTGHLTENSIAVLGAVVPAVPSGISDILHNVISCDNSKYVIEQGMPTGCTPSVATCFA